MALSAKTQATDMIIQDVEKAISTELDWLNSLQILSAARAVESMVIRPLVDKVMAARKTTESSTPCTCKLCKVHDKLRWATIAECKCACHDDERPSGHDSLCCAYPNGVRTNTPYGELNSAQYYKDISNKALEE